MSLPSDDIGHEGMFVSFGIESAENCNGSHMQPIKPVPLPMSKPNPQAESSPGFLPFRTFA